MINLTPIAEYLNIALHFMTCTLLLCGILVWTERYENLKQRTYLAIVWLVAGAMMMLRLLLTYKEGIPEAYPVLPIRNLYGGFWALLILFFYPVEAVSPGWLKWHNILVFLSPMIAISLILVIVPMEFTELHSWTDLISHVGEVNVWFRLLILFVIIIPYTILLLYVPYNWRKSSVDIKWIRIYVFGVQGIGILYILFMLTGSLLVSAIHLNYCMLFFMYVTYQELYLRLFHDTDQELSAEPIVAHRIDAIKHAAQAELKEVVDSVNSISSLWERFVIYMEHEEPWRSPVLTVNDVAKAIGSSRSVLSAEISSQGNGSFHSLVARYRVAAFCEMAQKDKITNVSEALLAVGFRSRSSAYERFKEQKGITPAEYVKAIKKGSI